MKKKIFICSSLILLCSCENDSKIVGGIKDDNYFKISEFNISENSIDLNNDNVQNSNMLLEIPNYFNNTYDLQIKTDNQSVLICFYIPKQNISFDYMCCPNGYVEFSKNGFTISTDVNQNIIENIEIDNETKIISLLKLNENSYKLFLEKKYFDFSTNQFVTKTYEIKYEITD